MRSPRLAKSRARYCRDLPTAHEQGLKDFDANTWNVLFVPPKERPRRSSSKLNDTVVETMNTPAVQERMHQLGVSLVASERRSPEYLQKFVEGEIAKWAGPIKAAGISMD